MTDMAGIAKFFQADIHSQFFFKLLQLNTYPRIYLGYVEKVTKEFVCSLQHHGSSKNKCNQGKIPFEDLSITCKRSS
jgi:hypothetical protein